MMLEVRCCCQPQKLLGWVQVHVDPDRMRVGNTLSFVIPPRIDGSLRDRAWTIRPARMIRLPVERYVDGAESHAALKSEETPIETLRQIPGFIENAGGPS